MNRITVAPVYSTEYLEIERPSPLSDNHIEQLIHDVLDGKLNKDITDKVYDDFKVECEQWIHSSNYNNIIGFEKFTRKDIINGCTQFIDNIYMKGPVQYIKGDYRYHQRLGYGQAQTVGNLVPGVPLIIAMPFPSIGAPHEQMQDILNECLDKQIAVHIDGAWYSCCRDIMFDCGHDAIRSIGISLSKGLGLGWNRVGLRWTKDTPADAVSIMNDFNMNLRAPAMIGLHFIRNLQPDHLWNTHGSNYYKICNDFNLTPTKSIYLALRNGHPVGVSPLLRYLENAK